MAIEVSSDIDDQLRSNIRLAYGRKTVRFALLPQVESDATDDFDLEHPVLDPPLLDLTLLIDLDPWIEQAIELSPPPPTTSNIDHNSPRNMAHTLHLSHLIQSYIGSPQHATIPPCLMLLLPLLAQLLISDAITLDDAPTLPQPGSVHRVFEPVNQLPVKRVYHPKLGVVRELPKLRRDFELDVSVPLCILKVKLTGVNFKTDFSAIKRPIVPALKFIGKVYASNGTTLDVSRKYLVFPFSTCLLQNAADLCHNCRHLANVKLLNQLSQEKFEQYPCQKSWTYGIDVDGGLQDYITIKHPEDVLIPVPSAISLHDACFMFERSLPLYSVLKRVKFPSSERVLMVLGSIDREINDVLLVLNHLGLDQRQFVFMDRHSIDELKDEQLELYRERFAQMLVFDISSTLLRFANHALTHKNDTNVFIFDQMTPCSRTKYFGDHSKNLHHVRLAHHHKADAVELMDIIADMNQVPPADFTYDSVSSSNTIASLSSSLLSDRKNRKEPKRRAWLNYDMDVDLCHDYHEHQPNSRGRTHTSNHINYYIRHPKYHRLCYNPRTSSASCSAENSNVIIL